MPSISGRFPLKFAVISATASGDTEVVAAVSGKRIRGVHYAAVCDTALDFKFKSGASTDITGAMPIPARGGVSADFEKGLFETAVGEALNINLSINGNLGGHLSFIEV